MTTGVYEIVNTLNGKRYVGQAQDVRSRWGNERGLLRRGHFHNAHLQRAWNKHGEEMFDFRIVLECEPHELTRLEQAMYDMNISAGIECYNVGPFLDCPVRGKPHTPEARAKMRSKFTSERRSMVSTAMRGNQYNLGRKHTPETRARNSEARRALWSTPEYRTRVSVAQLGRKHTPETRAKISAVQKGNKNCLGRKYRPETLAKMSAARKAWWASRKNGA